MEPFRYGCESLTEQGGANPGEHRAAENQRDLAPQIAPPTVVGGYIEIVSIRRGLDDNAAPDEPRQHAALDAPVGEVMDCAVGTHRIVAHQVRHDPAHCGTNCGSCGCHDFLLTYPRLSSAAAASSINSWRIAATGSSRLTMPTD